VLAAMAKKNNTSNSDIKEPSKGFILYWIVVALITIGFVCANTTPAF
jgi:hypothetical protein